MKIWTERDKKLNAVVHRASFWVDKKRYRLKAFSRKELDEMIVAVKSGAARKALGLESRAPKITLEQLVAEHVKDFDCSEEYRRRGKVVLEAFRDHLGSDREVESILRPDFVSFKRFRRSQNPKLRNTSLNKDLTYISGMFTKAADYFRELKDYNPPPMPWETVSRKKNDRTIYEDESAALLAFLRDPTVRKREPADSPQIREDYADMFELALNSLMRWGEIAPLEWQMINLRAAEIALPKWITKTDEPRIVPLNSRCIEILTRRKKAAKTRWVFPRKDGEGPRRYYYDRLRSIAKKLGLPFGRDVGFTLHTTRHTGITEMLNRGADLPTVQAISGQSDHTVAMNYAHTNKKRTREAVESLLRKTPDFESERTKNGQHELRIVVNNSKKTG